MDISFDKNKLQLSNMVEKVFNEYLSKAGLAETAKVTIEYDVKTETYTFDFAKTEFVAKSILTSTKKIRKNVINIFSYCVYQAFKKYLQKNGFGNYESMYVGCYDTGIYVQLTQSPIFDYNFSMKLIHSFASAWHSLRLGTFVYLTLGVCGFCRL